MAGNAINTIGALSVGVFLSKSKLKMGVSLNGIILRNYQNGITVFLSVIIVQLNHFVINLGIRNIFRSVIMYNVKNNRYYINLGSTGSFCRLLHSGKILGKSFKAFLNLQNF